MRNVWRASSNWSPIGATPDYVGAGRDARLSVVCLRDEHPLVWRNDNYWRKAGVARVIQQSIAMLNASGSDAWSDEDTVFSADDSVAGRAYSASLAMEDAVRGSALDWIILRGALFYGPGTGFEDDWFTRAREGRLRLPGDGADYVSLLHISDMAAATVAAVRHWPSRQTLIIADDEPAQWRDVFGFITQSIGAAAPLPGGRAGFPSFRVRNTRAKAALHWTPFYTNYQAGLIR